VLPTSCAAVDADAERLVRLSVTCLSTLGLDARTEHAITRAW